ncbi:hypothetical protein [Photorhabdus tasmaniensis]|uniref:Prevent-host-death protein n=1 Tax=Photorhabdus tasmaniensis TaxID=1004159 RepID=A0ABX0GBX5_9GAMM|nr:hypothetical protein [Photorhabdus tasmaniensis]NHB86470.1 hypothetical protein [Photorhabdus tasmaniensis]
MYQIQNSRITTIPAFKKKFEMQQEQMALLRLLSFAEKDVKAGRIVSSNELRDGLQSLAKS